MNRNEHNLSFHELQMRLYLTCFFVCLFYQSLVIHPVSSQKSIYACVIQITLAGTDLLIYRKKNDSLSLSLGCYFSDLQYLRVLLPDNTIELQDHDMLN